MTNRKVFGIRCDGAHKRVPSEWFWLCLNGKPMLWYSLDEAQKARDQVAKLPIAGVTWTPTLYGIERQ